MEETDFSQLSEAEIMSMYSNIIESGQEVLLAKSCPRGYVWDRDLGTGMECCRYDNPSNPYSYHGQTTDCVYVG